MQGTYIIFFKHDRFYLNKLTNSNTFDENEAHIIKNSIQYIIFLNNHVCHVYHSK